jgi:hypothetical protein
VAKLGVDGVIMDVKEVGSGGVNWIELAQNVVHTVMRFWDS